jgi:hypothetical protein
VAWSTQRGQRFEPQASPPELARSSLSHTHRPVRARLGSSNPTGRPPAARSHQHARGDLLCADHRGCAEPQVGRVRLGVVFQSHWSVLQYRPTWLVR